MIFTILNLYIYLKYSQRKFQVILFFYFIKFSKKLFLRNNYYYLELIEYNINIENI